MKCTFDPKNITDPIGMFHCPECGEMVVAGIEHPDYSKSLEELEREREEELTKMQKYADDKLNGDSKPTLNQIAWVLSHLNNAMDCGASYRYLIYDLMGFNVESGAYCALYPEGMNLTNLFCEYETLKEKF